MARLLLLHSKCVAHRRAASPQCPLRPAPCRCVQDIVLRPKLTGDQLGPLASEADGADIAAAERKLGHAASSSSDDLRASSANHIQSYISTHYNVRAVQRETC